jgi:3-phenylpropionate/cinnamic acid dioxygenase small subunit
MSSLTDSRGDDFLARLALHHEVEQFLFAEAALLDAQKHNEWLALLADDLEYWMPVRTTRARGEEALEFAKFGESAFFDDDKASIGDRVRKLHTGYAWAEDPPSRTRHYVTNVRIVGTSDDDVAVQSNFILHRSRLSHDEDLWFGRREDTLRRVDRSWLIRKRHIFLDHVSLASKNLSSFF